MKVKLKLGELTGTEAEYVSLVKRAANRSPIRIVKSVKPTENQMLNLDLSNIGRVFKAATQSATAVVQKTVAQVGATAVAALVVMKGSDAQYAAVTKAIKDAGFATDRVQVTKSDGGDIVLFAQGDTPDEGEALRLSEHLIVVIKGFKEHAEAMAKNMLSGVKPDGFVFGLHTAGELLQQHISKTLKAEGATTAAAADKIIPEIEKFAKYAAAYLAGVPEAVFKLDKLMAEAIANVQKAEAEAKVAEAKVKADAEAAAAAALKTATGKVVKMSRKDWDAMGDAGQKKYMADNKLTDAEDAVDGGADEAAEDAKRMKAATTAVEPLLSAMTKLTATVDGIAKAQQTTDTTVKELATKAEATEKALKGTVLASASGGDRPTGTAVKDEEDNEPIIDTAMQGRAKKYEHLGKAH